MTNYLILVVSFSIILNTISINMSAKHNDIDDRLAWLLKRFELKAHIFQTGSLRHPSSFQAQDNLGYIHVLKSGKLLLETVGKPAQRLVEPSILFYMNSTKHRLTPEDKNVKLVCASFEFGANLKNPLTQALPEMLILKQQDMPTLSKSLNLLFKEAEENHCGRQVILDRQIEIVIILLLRNLMDENRLNIGLLAGLADMKLAKAINAMHAEPEKRWSLEELAAKAGMSRARFANNFRTTVGMTPGHYLTEWRLVIAQSLLSQGKTVQLIADTIGYSNASALSRVFITHLGMSPSAWRKRYLMNRRPSVHS